MTVEEVHKIVLVYRMLEVTLCAIPDTTDSVDVVSSGIHVVDDREQCE